jgi:uncharacterized protein (TIGR03083 family)
MSYDDQPAHDDPLVELRFALAEGDAVDAPADLRSRVLAAASEARRPGQAVDAPARISGAEAFRRSVERLDGLLGDLSPSEWSRHALRDLDVQGLVGHLIGVEESFAAALGDAPVVEPDHIASTQPAARRQAGRPPIATHRGWFDSATASIAAVTDLDPTKAVAFYGVALPLDDLLVVRAFEMWIHDDDIRRATDRPLAAPDAERLARMVGLVTTLLPVGIARAGRAQAGTTARLVLTGTSGGTWDINLDGSNEQRRAESRIVIDAAEFCRVVGNRENQGSSGAVVTGDSDIAAGVFVGASALALD